MKNELVNKILKREESLTRSEIITVVLGNLCIIFILVGLCGVLKVKHDYLKTNSSYENVSDSFVKGVAEGMQKGGISESIPTITIPADSVSGDAGNENAEAADETVTAIVPEWYDYIEVDFDGLKKENEDIVGWLWFENEEISYPIMQSDNNEEYLHKTFTGEEAIAGSIFLDCNNSNDFKDPVSIIYGHNMRNKTMFGKLKYYMQDGYYEEHQYFQIRTPKAAYRYRIVSYKTVNQKDEIYQGDFDGRNLSTYMNEVVFKDSLMDLGINVANDDNFVILSTCNGSGSRFTITAVKVGKW